MTLKIKYILKNKTLNMLLSILESFQRLISVTTNVALIFLYYTHFRLIFNHLKLETEQHP